MSTRRNRKLPIIITWKLKNTSIWYWFQGSSFYLCSIFWVPMKRTSSNIARIWAKWPHPYLSNAHSKGFLLQCNKWMLLQTWTSFLTGLFSASTQQEEITCCVDFVIWSPIVRIMIYMNWVYCLTWIWKTIHKRKM